MPAVDSLHTEQLASDATEAQSREHDTMLAAADAQKLSDLRVAEAEAREQSEKLQRQLMQNEQIAEAQLAAAQAQLDRERAKVAAARLAGAHVAKPSQPSSGPVAGAERQRAETQRKRRKQQGGCCASRQPKPRSPARPRPAQTSSVDAASSARQAEGKATVSGTDTVTLPHGTGDDTLVALQQLQDRLQVAQQQTEDALEAAETLSPVQPETV